MKAALVDRSTGEMLTDRFRIPTPQPATPSAMTDVFSALLDHFDWTGPVGCAFPGVIRNGAIIETAANLHPDWVGVNAADLFGTAESPVYMVNDADAAGIAEMRFGAGVNELGTVFMLTIGTGLGTAIFLDGKLMPNTELGHLELDGHEAEAKASSRAKQAEDLSVEVWAARLDRYLNHVEALVWPDLFIIGGGISKNFDEFGPLLNTRARVVPALLRNHAGIVGAALIS